MATKLMTNVGGYIGRIEGRDSNGKVSFCRVDKYTEPKRFKQAVKYFMRKYDRKEILPADLWQGHKVKITAIKYDESLQLIRLKILKA